MYRRINRSLEYALMALKHLSSQKESWISVRDMAGKLHCPFDPFSKVMQKLTDHKIIQSKKGIGGGYALSTDLASISIYDLMAIILPSTDIVDCLSGDCHLIRFCNIRTPVSNLNNQLNDFYKNISVQNILNDHRTENKKSLTR